VLRIEINEIVSEGKNIDLSSPFASRVKEAARKELGHHCEFRCAQCELDYDIFIYEGCVLEMDEEDLTGGDKELGLPNDTASHNISSINILDRRWRFWSSFRRYKIKTCGFIFILQKRTKNRPMVFSRPPT